MCLEERDKFLDRFLKIRTKRKTIKGDWTFFCKILEGFIFFVRG